MPTITLPTAVEVVRALTTGSDLPVDYPETLVLYALGQQRLDALERKMENGVTSEAMWQVFDALREEMNALFPMVLESCDAERAARRCEWYAKVLRACAESGA